MCFVDLLNFQIKKLKIKKKKSLLFFTFHINENLKKFVFIYYLGN